MKSKLFTITLFLSLLSILINTKTNSVWAKVYLPARNQPNRCDRYDDYGSIKVLDCKIILDPHLQQELQEKIIIAREELQAISKILAINYSEMIGIGYFHQGQNNWELKFTFGGIILDTSETIILSTKQIFALKKIFYQTNSLVINGQKYRTTRSMIQFGPILHFQQG
jgi:hypothetical protein